MKFITVLVCSVVITVMVGLVAKNSKSLTKQDLISPLAPETNILGTISENTQSWQIFVNNYSGYKIKHPSDVDIKNNRNGDVSFQKSNNIHIYIAQGTLGENETINTSMETTINEKMDRLKENFKLMNSISPIAIGAATAQTYTSKENGEDITYYYVPQNDRKYLLITNSSPHNGTANYLISEDIIYSLEYLP
jgi:hypothetical protein